VPVAAIWGDRDRMVPPGDAATLQQHVPSAIIRFLPGAGHLPMVERPEAFAALLAQVAEL
jgi:pimeloyl-ACP methyl ester carboxylesterase